MLTEVIAIAVAGALGVLARFGLSRWVQALTLHYNFPWGILVCNVLGCFLIGIFYGVLEYRMALNVVWRSAILIGFLGGFTTFSSFSLDTFHFLETGQIGSGLINIFSNVSLCLLATTFGVWLAMTVVA